MRLNLKAVPLAVILFCSFVFSQNPSAPRFLRYSLPFKHGAIEIDPTDLLLMDVAVSPKLDSIRIIGKRKGSDFNLTLWVEPAKRDGGAQAAKNDWWPSQQKHEKDMGFKISDVQSFESSNMTGVEYLATVEKPPLTQRNIRAYYSTGQLWAEIHVDTVSKKDEDLQALRSFVKSVRLQPEFEPDSRAYLGYASVLYENHDYQPAAVLYQRALDLEKDHRQLSPTLWRVLVDNLGMSYGISHDLSKAKATFEYGISQDPDYPLFYYNMACTYGEMNDMQNAINYLKLAFARRSNVLASEKMPDPMTDDSFKRFWKNKQFGDSVRAMQ